MKKALSLLLVLVLSASLLTGCKKDDDGNSTAGTGAFPGTPAEGTVTLAILGEPAQLFSTRNSEAVSGFVLGHTMEGLVIRGEDGDFIGAGATDWTYDEETCTYTFTLRQDALWSNGEPVTAHDYVFAYRSLVNPEVAAPYAYFGYVFKNGQAVAEGNMAPEELGVRAIDDYTFEVQMEAPCPYALNVFGFMTLVPLNEAAYNEYGDEYGTDAAAILTNGPYVIDSWTHDSQIVLVRNENYYNTENTKIDTIILAMVSDKNTAMNMFMAGELDFMNDITGDQAVQLRELGANVETYNSNGVKYLQFQVNRPGLNNIKIRLALMMSIDTQALCDNILKDSSQPIYALVPDTIDGGRFSAVDGSPFFSYDPEGAKALLEEGLAEEGLTIEDLNQYTLICDDDDVSTRTAAFIVEQWKVNLGIDIQAQIVPRKSRIEALNTHVFDMVLSGWYPDYDDPNTYLDMFLTGTGNNSGDWSNERYDELIALAADEMDPEIRRGYFVEAQQILMSEAPIAPLYGMYRNYVISDKVDGEIVMGWQNTFRYAYIV